MKRHRKELNCRFEPAVMESSGHKEFFGRFLDQVQNKRAESTTTRKRKKKEISYSCWEEQYSRGCTGRESACGAPTINFKAATCTQNNTNRRNVHRHPCFKWDSNPRSQCFERAKIVHALQGNGPIRHVETCPHFFFTARVHTTESTIKILAANTHCKYFLKIAEVTHFFCTRNRLYQRFVQPS
jgi:hypothetical protein